jgi:hypothetical protein
MDNMLSLETCKQLKEWGCDVESELSNTEYIFSKSDPKDIIPISEIQIPAYDLRDIICNSEMAEAFFGKKYVYCGGYSEPAFMVRTDILKKYLFKNKKAEEYLLEHTIFNPKNKETK